MAAPQRFTPIQRNISSSSASPKPAEGFPMLPVFLIIVYVLYVAVAIIGPEASSQLADELDPVFSPTYRVVAAGVLFVLFAVLIVWKVFFGRSDPKEQPAPPVRQTQQTVKAIPAAPMTGASPKFKPVTRVPEAGSETPKKENKAQEKKEIEPRVIVYPLEVEGGIFGDTYIQLSPEKLLKLRSMVVEPEHLS